MRKPQETWRYCRCNTCELRFKTIEFYAIRKPGPVPGTFVRPRALGSRNARSVLLEPDVLKMRDMANAGTTQKELAKIFGMHSATVSKIITRKLWAHI